MSALANIRIGLVQMAVGMNKLENIKRAVTHIQDAKQKGSNLIVLPECFNSPYGTKHFQQYAEEVPSGETCVALSKAAKENSVFVIGGSIPEKEGSKLYNTCTVWNPEGKFLAKFRKIHLFDISVPGGITFKESAVLSPGNELTIVDIGPCKIGIGICYDLRFLEMASLYRDQGVDIIVYPGAFNMTTGPFHWELLLRARAVDNQVFVAACCGARDENADYVAWGHSMLVDPWGKKVVEAEASETTLIADIDLNACQKIRQQIPVSYQRRKDLYELIQKKPQV